MAGSALEHCVEQMMFSQDPPAHTRLRGLVSRAFAEDKLIANLILLFVAGHETTANAIGNGMLALLTHPAQLGRLRAEPALAELAVEEILRFEGPATVNGRVAHERIELDGGVIEPGELVFAMLGAANRDPAVFADPDSFDIARNRNPHVSFGGGIHHCLGASLARLEIRIALEQILARWPHIQLEASALRRRQLVNIRGLHQLPLRVN